MAAATWSKPRLVVGALDPSGKRQRGALVGNLWTDPLGRLWLFFDQTVVGVPGPTANWFIRCDNPDADAPAWSTAGVLCRGLHAEQADRAQQRRLAAAGLPLGGQDRVGLCLDRSGPIMEAARQRKISRLGVRRAHAGGVARRAAVDAGADDRKSARDVSPRTKARPGASRSPRRPFRTSTRGSSSGGWRRAGSCS